MHSYRNKFGELWLSQQKNFDHIFASVPVFDGTNKGDFSKWVERLEAACLQSGKTIYNEALGKVGVNVRMCLMGLPKNLMLLSIYRATVKLWKDADIGITREMHEDRNDFGSF